MMLSTCILSCWIWQLTDYTKQQSIKDQKYVIQTPNANKMSTQEISEGYNTKCGGVEVELDFD